MAKPRKRTWSRRRRKTHKKKVPMPVQIAKRTLSRPTLLPPLRCGQGVMVKLRYHACISINAGAGTIQQWTFRANDLYDPDLSGAGHQPRGFDQYCTFYRRFRVMYSKMSVLFNEAPTTPVTVFANLAADNGAPTDVLGWYELPSRRFTALNQQTSGKMLTYGFNGYKSYGPQYISDDIFAGTQAGSPTEQSYFQVAVVAADQVSDPGLFFMNVNIDYVAWFTEALLPVSS